MYKIKVDPKLFVTCRLCLDEMGHYQIDPNVQKQIKFCYDIDVDPFDGLPQLICKKCETILTDFGEKKKRYQEKQLGLEKNSKCNTIVPESLQQQDIVSSTQTAVPETKPKQSFKLTLKKKPKSPDSNLNDSFVISKRDAKEVRTWRKNYNKYFACRFCNGVYKSKNAVMQHIVTHNAWLEKYGQILKTCKIQLPRIDEKSNFIGSDAMVVFDKDQILHNKYNQYRVFYKRKTLVNTEKKSLSESSDDDTFNTKKRKRLRLISQSSNETVVLEDPKKNEEDCSSSKSPNNVIACVDIDSSDSEQPAAKSDVGRTKMIRDIVASCVKKFMDKDFENTSFRDTQLQHKIISIGRKVINNKSFNCTGLLRYLEHKNLDIQWNPKSGQNPESQYVHIRTKLQYKKEESETGWRVASDLKGSDIATYIENLQKILESDAAPASNQTEAEATLEQAKETNLPHENLENMLSKLLNTNPVANPKQLPKKTREGTKSVSNDTNLSMPVITNTVSLADAEVASEKENAKDTPFVPRIKVKPVSQLMADKTAVVNETTPAQVAWTIPENIQPHAPIVQTDWVVMHTVELPRTKTISPFKYFQNLLQMHGIVLLDTTVQVPSDFVSLIKFKSVFKQERKRVTLSLCLLSDSKQFYIKVTDSTNLQLDVNTLIPTWQWEILSLYKSDIASNILENAKKVNQKMFDSTNYFISLLRSIIFIRPE